MGSISLLQWRKSYMLEFLEGDDLKECFTFSVPPESEELQFPQRVTETKTFGGSVFDDYGNDSYRIILSGTTINEEKKLIYRGKKVPLYLTGTKEIFELQKIIKNWSDGKVSTGFFRKTVNDKIGSDRKVYLYDLSKMSVLQLATGVASRNYWRVFIKDLKIKRDKSKPKTYNYSLEMIAVDDDKKKANGFFGDVSFEINALQDVMDGISTVMSITEATTAAAAEVADHCARVKLAAEMVKNRDITDSLVALNVGSGLDLVSRIRGGDSNSFYNSTKNLLHSCTVFGGLAKDNSDTAQKGKIQQTSNFDVSFNSNGGSSVSNQKLNYSEKATRPATDPTRTDYTFDNWYSDSALTTVYDFNTEVTSNITLYAKWNLATATITFNSRNGSPVTPKKVEVGTVATPPTPPTRSGYAFDKWYTDYACTHEYDWTSTVDSNFTLYVGWIKTFNIVFNSNGGSAVTTQTVTTGGLAVYPKTPTKENYTFAYWCTDSELTTVYDFSTPVNADITLYACLVQISNTVTFNSQGGSAVESQRVVIGGYATKPATDPTKEGYDFVYWATDAAGTNEFRFNTTAINTNITLYAKWTETICDVTFDSDGGSAVETQNVGYGNKAIFPEIPVKEGYSFEMWRTRKEVEVPTGETDENDEPIMTTEYQYEEFDFSTPITEDITLYALWFGGE